MNKPLLATGAVLFGALTFAAPESASADVRVHVGGGVRIGPRSHWRAPVYRPYYRPYYSAGGAIWVGGAYGGYDGYRTYAAPPPAPSCNCVPGAVPSYYPGYYTQAPQNVYYSGATAPAPLPRLGIGAFTGGLDVDGENGNDLGLLARLRLSGGWMLEGELGVTEMQSAQDLGLDPDTRFGGALVYEIGTRNTWAPYLVAGLGAIQTDNSEADARGYGEIGVGLRWALTDHLHLAFDVRAGAQDRSEQFDQPVILEGSAAARIASPVGQSSTDDSESYTRGRLSVMLYF